MSWPKEEPPSLSQALALELVRVASKQTGRLPEKDGPLDPDDAERRRKAIQLARSLGVRWQTIADAAWLTPGHCHHISSGKRT